MNIIAGIRRHHFVNKESISQIENQVGNVREWLFTPRVKFETLDDLNRWLESDAKSYQTENTLTFHCKPLLNVFSKNSHF